jgi:hypothetical protein
MVGALRVQGLEVMIASPEGQPSEARATGDGSTSSEALSGETPTESELPEEPAFNVASWD